MKICKICKLDKEAEDYYKNIHGKYGLYSRCIQCCRELANKCYNQNPEKYKQANKRYYIKHPTAKRNADLKYYFGINLEIYNEILEKQNNCCAICKRHISLFKRGFDVDHCHETKKIRGLLCNPCNQALGLFKDNIEIIENAKNYLNVYKK